GNPGLGRLGREQAMAQAVDQRAGHAVAVGAEVPGVAAYRLLARRHAQRAIAEVLVARALAVDARQHHGAPRIGPPVEYLRLALDRPQPLARRAAGRVAVRQAVRQRET